MSSSPAPFFSPRPPDQEARTQGPARQSTQPSSCSMSSASRRPYDPCVIGQAEALVDGCDVSSVDPALCSDIHSYLRAWKVCLLAKRPPDYLRAQRIDELCSELLLLIGQRSYCTFKTSEADRLQLKIDDARAQLRWIVDEREQAFAAFSAQRDHSMSALHAQQESELSRHDEYYSGDLPAKFRHFSGEVLQVREQERFLRQSKRYAEAMRMMEEADALEAFEIEKLRAEWYNTGVAIRQAIVRRHDRQMQCLLEKCDRVWAAILPESVAKERHWLEVIARLEGQMKRERGESTEIQKTTRALLRKADGLPPLGPTAGPNRWRKVTTVNNRRTYTNYARGRARSGFH